LIKRRIREATKSIASEIAKNHHDYVIIAKKQILEVDYKKIYNDLKFCFKRI
jgi:ribonuclease P protein component